MAKSKRSHVKGEAITVTASIVLAKTLLASAAFDPASNVQSFFNIDGAQTLYLAMQSSAPSSVADMIPILPGTAIEWRYQSGDADTKFWIAASGTAKARVTQDYEQNVP
jgi:hypothetical protein